METPDFKHALGQLIYELRQQQALSQERLAHDADVDRTRMGEIERGGANPTIDTLSRVAGALEQTLGSLIIQAEEISGGITKRPAPTINPAYLDRAVPLPRGLTHDQLATALNRAQAILDQVGINPESGDIQLNIYSGAVSNIVTKSIAETSRFVQNPDTDRPDLFDPELPRNERDWGLELKATRRPGKGGESHNPGTSWFMVIVYAITEGQTRIVQVEVAYLLDADWVIHDRKEGSSRTRTAVTTEAATRTLRQNSVYLDPAYTTREVRRAIKERNGLYEF